MKQLIACLIFLFAFSVIVCAQKIETTYWNCTLGTASEQGLESLNSQNLNPIVTEDGIYLQDKDIYGVRFATIGLKFTTDNMFYNVFGYNKYNSKKEANVGFDTALSEIQRQYPNVQAMSKSENCLRLYAYTDDGHENVFSIGLYKGANGDSYFVRLNIYSDYLVKKSLGKE